MRTTLLVIYTPDLEACNDFYTGFGLPMVREQHGAGPVHYAAEFEDGFVFEVYPATSKEPTGRARLGFSVPAGPLPSGTHRLTDPDGRIVIVTAEPTAAEAEARKAATDLFGADAVVTFTAHGGGAESIDITLGGGRSIVIDHSGEEWGVSVDPADAEGMTGHDDVTGSLDEALRLAHAKL
ncbi:VOC family protein [Streptomyces uncialis]|uniref:VOC family protein n=1 Tax=Streptomyces uncialis TaxID=1048205 RepID=UPI00380DC127